MKESASNIDWMRYHGWHMETGKLSRSDYKEYYGWATRFWSSVKAYGGKP
jgi:hypothetical protein